MSDYEKFNVMLGENNSDSIKVVLEKVVSVSVCQDDSGTIPTHMGSIAHKKRNQKHRIEEIIPAKFLHFKNLIRKNQTSGYLRAGFNYGNEDEQS